ncbi:hypothetical protein ABD80_20465 [Bacillus atrophaeus]|uniref:Uncharacterized protein n=1 Tax=Bacillus atrophaeus (strain 1942) TaxID=720555 RepID=A0ABN3ZDB5_BACA1|nr:hypothetical protein BATR1942_07915 [Bacillus atrophaeus 1942]AMR62633.1 hypothetical protein A1D11_09535 [Bacillus subtilis subsp. globigii]EIM11682.1 hypothetical protein UY9_05447 [Bacillus atrophaeus C89]MBG9762157.1 hypothetical protein [Bacillus atrophaeus]MDR4396280.1 hypothetical protein [Bacillus atrophaeus]
MKSLLRLIVEVNLRNEFATSMLIKKMMRFLHLIIKKMDYYMDSILVFQKTRLQSIFQLKSVKNLISLILLKIPQKPSLFYL